MMRMPLRYVSLLLGLLVITGCAGYGSAGSAYGGAALSDGARAQFDCANRNGNEYIERAELVFLVQCGVSENQSCGTIPEEPSDQAPNEQFRQGRRLLEIMDLDKDGRISRLEFRAFCNQNR